MSVWNPRLLLFLSINVYEHIPANNTKKKKKKKTIKKTYLLNEKKKKKKPIICVLPLKDNRVRKYAHLRFRIKLVVN